MGNTLRKRLIGIELTLLMMLIVAYNAQKAEHEAYAPVQTAYCIEETQLPETALKYKSGDWRILHGSFKDEQEQIRNEIMYGEIELLAQVVEAEAGNQDAIGKRYVADVVLNRMESASFPDTAEEVIYQKNPVQFSCIKDGNFNKAGWSISEESFNVAFEEYTGDRLNKDIIYFRTKKYSSSGHPAFQHGAHYFSTK